MPPTHLSKWQRSKSTSVEILSNRCKIKGDNSPITALAANATRRRSRLAVELSHASPSPRPGQQRGAMAHAGDNGSPWSFLRGEGAPHPPRQESLRGWVDTSWLQTNSPACITALCRPINGNPRQMVDTTRFFCCGHVFISFLCRRRHLFALF